MGYYERDYFACFKLTSFGMRSSWDEDWELDSTAAVKQKRI